MTEELALLAYELSQRMLAQQEMRLDELRARTGTLLAASSVATSFLGPRAIDRDGVDTLALLALTAFAVSVIGSVSIRTKPQSTDSFSSTNSQQWPFWPKLYFGQIKIAI